MKVGLFFGSFNPIHLGHMQIIQYFSDQKTFDEIWVVVSPQNPSKERHQLIEAKHRLNMVRLAIKELEDARVSDIEFHLPTPSYTLKSLKTLSQKHPHHSFEMIMGSDTATSLHTWKNHEEIMAKYPVHIYPRKHRDTAPLQGIKHTQHSAKEIDISSSLIRVRVKEHSSIQNMVSPKVWEYGREIGIF